MNHLKSLAIAAVLGAASSSFALSFNITSTGNAQADAGFAAAAAQWSALFTDDMTVNITAGFSSLGSGILGQAGSTKGNYSYSSVRSALFADATSSADAIATANLDAGSSAARYINRTSNNGNSSAAYVHNGAEVRMSRANAKALGLVAGHAAGQDAAITFSTNFTWDFDQSDGITAGTFDFIGVAAHEIGHALGFISEVDILDFYSYYNNPISDDDVRMSTLDLYRYSNIGGGNNRAFLSGTTDSFFSIDGGVTLGPQFSEGVYRGDGRQASHWKDNLGLGILDPTGAPGELLMISGNDTLALDAIGYDAVPEPATMTLLGLGVAALAARRKKKA